MFFTKFLQNVNKPILKGLCKFQVDVPRVMQVMQELGQFKVLKISIHLYCGSHVGGQKNALQPIFPYNIIEKNPPTFFPHNSASNDPNNFKFDTETGCMVL